MRTSVNLIMICPYYRGDYKDGSMICDCGKIKFGSKANMKKYMRRYCANNPDWQKCTLAKHMTETILGEEHEKSK